MATKSGLQGRNGILQPSRKGAARRWPRVDIGIHNGCDIGVPRTMQTVRGKGRHDVSPRERILGTTTRLEQRRKNSRWRSGCTPPREEPKERSARVSSGRVQQRRTIAASSSAARSLTMRSDAVAMRASTQHFTTARDDFFDVLQANGAQKCSIGCSEHQMAIIKVDQYIGTITTDDLPRELILTGFTHRACPAKGALARRRETVRPWCPCAVQTAARIAPVAHW